MQKKQNKKKCYIEQEENTINLSQVVELLGNNQNDRWSPSQNVSRMHFLKDFLSPKTKYFKVVLCGQLFFYIETHNRVRKLHI